MLFVTTVHKILRHSTNIPILPCISHNYIENASFFLRFITVNKNILKEGSFPLYDSHKNSDIIHFWKALVKFIIFHLHIHWLQLIPHFHKKSLPKKMKFSNVYIIMRMNFSVAYHTLNVIFFVFYQRNCIKVFNAPSRG